MESSHGLYTVKEGGIMTGDDIVLECPSFQGTILS
jgi:hypothetical protein